MRLAAILLAVATVAVPARGAPTPAHVGASTAAPCRPNVRDGVLPVWMRAGFSGQAPRIPHVFGRRGTIGGVLFGWPLHAPPAPGRNNKILWVPRRPAKSVAALWIRLQRMQGAQPVGAPIRRIIPTGPGPSIVDVPSAGCWRLTLSWSGRRDTLDLPYTPPG
jgi:hypothetical protein